MIICVDAGHGAVPDPHDPDQRSDPGARAPTGECEADLALRWARTLARCLRMEGLTVVETRPTERFVSLEDRAKIANEAGAALFVSVHCNNAPGDPTDHGALTLYAEPSERGRAIAAEIQPKLAALMGGEAGAVYPDVKPHTNYKSGVYVLRATRMPAILLELGFVSNAADLARLKDDAYRAVSCALLARQIRTAMGEPAPKPEPGGPAPVPAEVVIPPATPEVVVPPPAAPEPPVLHTITVPAPPEDAHGVGALLWAREAARDVARQAGELAADLTRQRGAELLEPALEEIRAHLEARTPSWLVGLLWPLVEREARRALEGER